MNYKAAFILTFLSITLVGCGGGSSSKTDTKSKMSVDSTGPIKLTSAVTIKTGYKGALTSSTAPQQTPSKTLNVSYAGKAVPSVHVSKGSVNITLTKNTTHCKPSTGFKVCDYYAISFNPKKVSDNDHGTITITQSHSKTTPITISFSSLVPTQLFAPTAPTLTDQPDALPLALSTVANGQEWNHPTYISAVFKAGEKPVKSSSSNPVACDPKTYICIYHFGLVPAEHYGSYKDVPITYNGGDVVDLSEKNHNPLIVTREFVVTTNEGEIYVRGVAANSDKPWLDPGLLDNSSFKDNIDHLYLRRAYDALLALENSAIFPHRGIVTYKTIASKEFYDILIGGPKASNTAWGDGELANSIFIMGDNQYSGYLSLYNKYKKYYIRYSTELDDAGTSTKDYVVSGPASLDTNNTVMAASDSLVTDTDCSTITGFNSICLPPALLLASKNSSRDYDFYKATYATSAVSSSWGPGSTPNSGSVNFQPIKVPKNVKFTQVLKFTLRRHNVPLTPLSSSTNGDEKEYLLGLDSQKNLHIINPLYDGSTPGYDYTIATKIPNDPIKSFACSDQDMDGSAGDDSIICYMVTVPTSATNSVKIYKIRVTPPVHASPAGTGSLIDSTTVSVSSTIDSVVVDGDTGALMVASNGYKNLSEFNLDPWPLKGDIAYGKAHAIPASWVGNPLLQPKTSGAIGTITGIYDY